MTRPLVLLTIVLVLAPLRAGAQQTQDLPRFTTSIELTSIDVSVLDGSGRPVPSLTADDFAVRIDGSDRTVVSAEWVQLELPSADVVAPPPGYSSNDSAGGGRLVLIVVDQPNIRFGGTLAIRKAVNGFIDRLQPSDRTAVIGLGRGAPSTSFTADRARLKKTIELLVGQYQPIGISLHNIGLQEALDIAARQPQVLRDVVNRECRDPSGAPLDAQELDACSFEIEQEAQVQARSRNMDARDTITALRAILTALRRIDGPKTMIFVSEGFLAQDAQADVAALGTAAAAARTSIYALKLDDTLFSVAASESRMPIGRMDDRMARAEGMNILVGASRGSLYNVIGSGGNVFERIEAELGGYYLLGIESGPADKNGKAHSINVEVRRKGLTVKSRRSLIVAPEDRREPRNPREAVFAAMTAPLPIGALPLRLATYSLQGPEADRVQILLHADIGGGYAQSRPVFIAYTIMDADGREIDGQVTSTRLLPVMNGVPSSLQYTAGASLPPGEYLVKLAASDGERVGTVEHTFTAGVTPAGAVRLSDLMIGGPVDMREELLQPSVSYTVVFGAVHGYIEAYGPEAANLKATYEVSNEPDGAPILTADVPPYNAGRQRTIFTRVMSVRQLPPGKYHLRVKLSGTGAPAETKSGEFEIAAPAVLMTSASASSPVSAEVYLPVSELLLSHAFDPSAASGQATIQIFREHVPDPQREAFDRGVAAFTRGAFGEAEASFKDAVTPEDDSSSALAYMAATFAASGHDEEAIGAWQTALVDGSERPEIYEWLADALMRHRDLGLARSLLEEAVSKWPSDARFARPMALVYATFGQGREAMRSLERYLAVAPDDVAGLQMAVEWLYQLHAAKAAAHSPAEDLKLARGYASAYDKAKGPQAALVKQWIDAMQRN